VGTTVLELRATDGLTYIVKAGHADYHHIELGSDRPLRMARGVDVAHSLVHSS
jgi:hypothetical protein